MKCLRRVVSAPALVILLLLPAACATSRTSRTAARTPSEVSVAAADAPVASARTPKPEARPAREAPKGPTLDRQGCDPKGRLTLVVQNGTDGQPSVWRYYATFKRGGVPVRVLKCEASDNNGDGFIDARFFFDDNGQLVLEQRDLDFDGHAEVIADYSHFSFGHLVQASDSDKD
jgi:hypothetical protein